MAEIRCFPKNNVHPDEIFGSVGNPTGFFQINALYYQAEFCHMFRGFATFMCGNTR